MAPLPASGGVWTRAALAGHERAAGKAGGRLALAKPIQFRNILLGTDFSASSAAAVPYAAAMARHYEGKVYVAHVSTPETYGFVPPSLGRPRLKQVQAHARTQMAEFIQSARLHGVPHETLFGVGEVVDVFWELVPQHGIDLIAVGTRGRRGLNKLIMGSVAEEIFRLAQVPVLTVSPGSLGRRKPFPFRRILFPTDFSADSERARDVAVSLAEEFEAQLLLLHVTPGPAEDVGAVRELSERIAARLRELLPAERLLRCQVCVEHGSPAEEILRAAAEHKADLIVMGVRGAGALVRMSTTVGSTAHEVVSQARAPVLTVRGIQKS
jgi:nucleotide-binding universal stress UspA family protein